MCNPIKKGLSFRRIPQGQVIPGLAPKKRGGYA
ncbi:Hypothetical protein Minf_1678 [Methylacidiphilum infernorum V4]|uniref:Uncharacterized protein n=1 Tax=Methylacidiphilum infernorum (isolate V4) TaxID=481448 RepID=B3DWR9_METI4|nr:Hypothetical protein Minf_1678 [Methylacidiphilum infernorum V4]